MAQRACACSASLCRAALATPGSSHRSRSTGGRPRHSVDSVNPTAAAGVTGQTTYNAAIAGLGTRGYNAAWQSPSGTAGVEWTPDNDSLYYFKYGRGYKSGGYNIGIFTVLSFTAGDRRRARRLARSGRQAHLRPLPDRATRRPTSTTTPTCRFRSPGPDRRRPRPVGTSFYNVPKSVQKASSWRPPGRRSTTCRSCSTIRTTTPTSHRGTAADPADPNAVQPGASRSSRRPVPGDARRAVRPGLRLRYLGDRGAAASV